MLFTEAIIQKTPDIGTNKFTVRVPLFEDNTGTEATFSALLCNQPGHFNGYSVGDVVFVLFKDDNLNIPVIMGRLYTDIEKDSKSYTITNELNVTHSANLPTNTTIGGFTPKDIFQLYQKNDGAKYIAGYGIKIENGIISLDLDYAHNQSF